MLYEHYGGLVAGNIEFGTVMDHTHMLTDLSSFKIKQHDMIIISYCCHICWFWSEQKLNFQTVVYLLKLGLAKCL